MKSFSFITFTIPTLSSLKEKWKSPFPYYLGDDRKNILLIISISLFLVLFLITFEPASEYLKIVVVGTSTLLALLLTIILLPRLFPVFFDSANWTVGKYILFTLWQLLVIGLIVAYTLFKLGFHPGDDFSRILIDVYSRVLTHGIIPISMVTLLLQNHLTNEHLKQAIRANVELDKIKNLKDDSTHEKAARVTIYSDTKDVLTINLSDLLYVEASENYSNIYWKSAERIEKTMLRINLKNVESQLDNHFTVRCHRSYIVNISAINHVRGNANGYKLSIKESSFSVPVSRSKGREVIDKIEHLRNMFEVTTTHTNS